MHRVVFQADGAAPLHVASNIGHLECMQALLDGGAAVNQALVCCENGWQSSVCGNVLEAPCMFALRAWMSWGRVFALVVVESMSYVWRLWCTRIIGCSSHLLVAVLCAPCGGAV